MESHPKQQLKDKIRVKPKRVSAYLYKLKGSIEHPSKYPKKHCPETHNLGDPSWTLNYFMLAPPLLMTSSARDSRHLTSLCPASKRPSCPSMTSSFVGERGSRSFK